MQVSVEQTGGLERRLIVQVPADQVETEVDNRLKSLARTARIDGFRPGKVPLKVVQRKFAGRVRQEVVGELIRSTYHDALTQQNLRPAGDPHIEPTSLEPGKDLQYTATFEVYPELHLAPMEDLEVERPVAEVTAQDVDEMLETLRQQRTRWVAVERPARRGDRLNIDYAAIVEGAEAEGRRRQDVPVVLGSGNMLEGFEARLEGAKAGDHLDVDLTFPADYSIASAAGKPVRFEVTIRGVAEPELPDIDDAFAEAFGVHEGGVPGLRREVQANMQRELQQAINARVKEQVLEGLLRANNIEVPASLVDKETDRLAVQAQAQAPESARSQGMTLPRSLFADQARRRVALGLLIAEIVRSQGMRVDPARVRATIETIASSYEDPEEVVKWYYGNPELLGGVEALALEEQVVASVLEHGRVVDRPTTFRELMKPGQPVAQA